MLVKKDGKVQTLDSTGCYIWPISRHDFNETNNACLVMEDISSRINWNMVFQCFSNQEIKKHKLLMWWISWKSLKGGRLSERQQRRLCLPIHVWWDIISTEIDKSNGEGNMEGESEQGNITVALYYIAWESGGLNTECRIQTVMQTILNNSQKQMNITSV
jgi:hypothetical protein